MKVNRLSMFAAFAGCVVAAGCAQTADSDEDATDYPTSSVRVVVPFPAGSPTDLATRLVSNCVETELGQSVVVENVDGGEGLVGMSEVAQAKPDGYTIGVGSTSSLVVAPYFVPDAGFDAESFDAIGAYTLTPQVIAVAPDSSITTIEDVVESSAALTVVTTGQRSSGGLMITSLSDEFGARLNQVPMNGEADAIRGLQNGDYDVAVFAGSQAVLEALGTNQIQPLALSSTFSELPDVPSMDDLGYGDNVPIPEVIGAWVVPAGTPDGVQTVIADALSACTTNDELRATLGATVPEEFFDGDAVEAAHEDVASKLEELQP